VVAATILPLSTATAATASWDAPITVSAPGVDSVTSPTMVSNGSVITAVFGQYDGSHYRVQSARSTNNGLTWSTPVYLSAPGGTANQARLTTDGSRVTATWRWNDGSNFRIQSAFSLNGGLTWSAVTTVSEVGQSTLAPRVATDGTTITIAWERLVANVAIAAATSTDGGQTWSTPATLSDPTKDAFNPQLVSHDGRVTVMWELEDGGVYRVQSSQSSDGGLNWSGATSLSPNTFDAVEPELVADGTTVVAAWRQFDGTYWRIHSARSVDGGAWSASNTVDDGASSGSYIDMTTDGDSIVIAWRGFDGIHNRITSVVSEDGGQNWSAPQFLSEPGQGADRPALASDGSKITAVWLRSDGTTNQAQVAWSLDAGSTWSTAETLSTAGDVAAAVSVVSAGGTSTVSWVRLDVPNSVLLVSSLTGDVATSRLAGADRYETAVAISGEFDPGVPVVYLATGTNFPDALSAASAAAFQGGPMLLTPPNSLPQMVRDELQRLNPSLIVIVGGAGVVSANIEDEIDDLLLLADVRRDGGADRYKTSRLIAERAFPAAATSTAFVATGTNFPDALSASAAAGVAGAPVVLIDGAGSAVDQPTRDLFDLLGVEDAVIAGGTGVVSASIQGHLNTIFGASNVVRLSGADRYATAVAINHDQFTSSDTVFLATGLGYADALAGAALAGVSGGPLYLAPRTCVPASVLAEIDRLGASKAVLFGGTGVLTPSVASLSGC